jgi:hypothetical protein
MMELMYPSPSPFSISNPINFNRRDFKCKDTVVSLYDLVGGNLEVKMTGNKSYFGMPNRTLGEIFFFFLVIESSSIPDFYLMLYMEMFL